MSTDDEPPAALTPPGPPLDEVAERRTGGLSVDEWIEEQRRRSSTGEASSTAHAAYYGAVPHQPPPSRTMANWAVALSLALCIPFAFVVATGLAITVLVKSRNGRDHGRGRAIAALVVSGIILVVNGVALVVGLVSGWDETERDADGRVVDGGSVSIDRLQVGDCFNDTNLVDLPDDGTEGEASPDADVVPCAEPHHAEVFHLIELEGKDHPGADAIDARLAECFPEFQRYVGAAYGRSPLEVAFMYPTELSWRLGNRVITCVLMAPDSSDLEGSMARSRR